MIERKKKLRIVQFCLLIFGLLIIYLTYYNKEISDTDPTNSEQVKEALKDEGDDDLFFNIESISFFNDSSGVKNVDLITLTFSKAKMFINSFNIAASPFL